MEAPARTTLALSVARIFFLRTESSSIITTSLTLPTRISRVILSFGPSNGFVMRSKRLGGLGLEQFYLLGQSWGGVLAIEYALAYPQHLKGLIISNMTASTQSYEKYVRELRAALPDDVIKVLDRYEQSGLYEAPEYEKVLFEQVCSRHLCRLNPVPEPLLTAIRNLNQKIYNYMQGPNEFVVTGTLKSWDRWADLPRIGTRTLVMGAKYDEMSPEDLRKMADLTPNARVWISEKGSHSAMYDDQLAYFTELLTFLKSG
jgi:proline iminopeptidase